MTQTEQFTLSDLMQKSDVELAVERLKIQGFNVRFFEERWQYRAANDWMWYTVYPTEAGDALLLLDEMENATFWSHCEQRFCIETSGPVVEVLGKPSVALPRAITISYILSKQQNP